MDLNLSLSDDLASFVQSEVQSGRHASPSEVVCEALRLLMAVNELRASESRWLQRAWQDGVTSGDFQQLDLHAVKTEGRKRIGWHD